MKTLITYSERKDYNNMSFVGLCVTPNGIVSFSDSKSTLLFSDGTMKADLSRKPTQKTFKNSKFICVTHGNNTLYESNKEINLEDWINKHLDIDEELDVFFSHLNQALQYNPYNPDSEYFFYVGGKDYNGYFLQTVHIKPKDNIFQLSSKTYSPTRICGGDNRYLEVFERFIPFYFDKPLEEIKQSLEIQIKSCINIFDSLPSYNSVGEPLNIDVFI